MRRAARLLVCVLIGLLAATVMLSEQALHPLRRDTADLPPGWRVESVQALTVPGLEGERHLVTVTRAPAETA